MNFNVKQEIAKCVKNADEKLSDAENLANKGSYGTASSLLVTSFEERCKAVTLQIIDLGFDLGNLNDIQYIFTQHDFRHYIGFFADCFNEIMKDMEKALNVLREFSSLEAILEFIVQPDNVNTLKNWFAEKIDSFIKKIDFYKNIEYKRQNGFYVDIYSGKTPTHISAQEYENIKLKLNSIHWISTQLNYVLEAEWWNKGEEKKAFLPVAVSMELLPDQVQKTISVVRKKRNKLFNVIKKKLFDLRLELIDKMEYDKFIDVSMIELIELKEKLRLKRLNSYK